MSSKIVGKDCKVTLGAYQVLGLGTWSMDGITTDEFESTEFGDEWKTYEYGAKDGGTITFNGLRVLGDTTGQDALLAAQLYNSTLTNLFLFDGATSHWEPCQTTGYWSPALTTGAPTQLGSVRITQISINNDKSALGQISFTGKVSGPMVFV